MTPLEAQIELQNLCRHAQGLLEVAKTAHRNRKSLSGDNHYGHKFHHFATVISSILTKVMPALCQLTDKGAKNAVDVLRNSSQHLISPDVDSRTRMRSYKDIDHACKVTLLHALDALGAPAQPLTEQVLPMSVVSGTRGYLESMILQANGCYERGWYDASSVMIRKFVESLIIQVYEHAKRAAHIKIGGKPENDFLMLADLVDRIINDRDFNLARECKRTLPLVKQLGDRAAHNRRYLAKKADVDNIVPGLRVAADDLLHLGGLK